VFKGVFSLRSWTLIVICLVIMTVLPQFLTRFYTYLASLVLVTGLLAMSLNLVLGYGGLYQFHHAVFYGIGAYAFALVRVKTGLPGFWAYLAAPFAGLILGLIMGLICIRLSKLYFGMLQISLGSLVWAIVFRWYSFTGGDDGIHGIPISDALSSIDNAYYFTAAITVVCLFLMYLIVNSPFGRVFQATRDNPERSAAIGVDVKRHQLVGLVLAGFFAGIAGSLFVTIEGSVFPDMMFWTLSLEILIMCLLGGWFFFLGFMLGAAIVVILRTVMGIHTEYWTLVLGVILMLLIFFLPEGVLGFFTARWGSRRRAAMEDL
jgi:branched-chain amino acid transport system permease protein